MKRYMTWNRVVTIEDFWDRPRGGIAFKSGKLVAYKCLWDDREDDYSDYYGVMPINEALLPQIEESWEIWIRWSNAFDAGETTTETHPALPQDRKRYAVLASMIKPQTEMNEAICEKLLAEFRSIQPGWTGIEVRWHKSPTD